MARSGKAQRKAARVAAGGPSSTQPAGTGATQAVGTDEDEPRDEMRRKNSGKAKALSKEQAKTKNGSGEGTAKAMSTRSRPSGDDPSTSNDVSLQHRRSSTCLARAVLWNVVGESSRLLWLVAYTA